MSISSSPGERCSARIRVPPARLDLFNSQEQLHHLFMPIYRSPYEWRHTRTICFVHIPSAHLYQTIGNFSDAKVRDTVQ